MKKVEKHGDYEVEFLSGKDVDDEIERLEKEVFKQKNRRIELTKLI